MTSRRTWRRLLLGAVVFPATLAFAGDDAGPLLLAIAVDHADVAAMQDILGRIGPNGRDLGETVLARAVRSGRIEPVRLLIAAGARVDERCADGMTVLGLAVLNGDEAIVRALLDAGADVDAKTAAGDRPLTIALRAGRNALAMLLLDRGARDDVVDGSGVTAVDLAARYADDAVMNRLLAALPDRP